MIEPPSVSDSSTACRAMVDEHAVDVEAGADRFADLAQRLELRRPCRASSAPLASSSCTSLTPLTAIGCLCGERRDDRHLPIVERAHVVAPDAEHADDLVVEDHRGAHRRPETGHPLEVLPPVLGVGQHIGDLLCLAVQADAAEEGLPVEWHRVLGDERGRLIGETDRLDQPVDTVLQDV